MITTKQRSNLRGLANNLQPLVIVGKGGLSDSLFAEIEQALFHRELIKISVLKSCETERTQLMQDICNAVGCQPVSCVGNKMVVYKYSTKKDIQHLNF